MTTFAWVEIYTDFVLNGTTYTEDGLHKPVFPHPADLNDGAPLPDTNYMVRKFQNVTPRKGREFSEMEVPLNYSECSPLIDIMRKTPKCLKIGNMIGWIDSLEPIATKGPSYNTLIRWHIDYYLTGEYIRYEHERWQFAPYPVTTAPLYTLGAGRIRRGPKAIARPSSNVPRLWIYQAAKNLMPSVNSTKVPWVIISYTKTDPNTHYTTITYLNWQPGVSITDGGNTYSTPSWDDVYGGLIEEKLGLDANAVIGAWVAPMSASESSIYTHTVSGTTYAAYEYYNSGSTVTAVFDMLNHVQTDDLIKWVFQDTTGTEMFTAPWGLSFRYIIEQIDVGSSGANVMFYLATKSDYDAAAGDYSKLSYASEGRLFSFPLPALPVTENAWQSYNYTGERAYDIEMREIQKNQNAINGIAGVGTSAIGGAIAGSMVMPGPGTVAGAVAGIATGAISTVTNYATSGHYDNRTQEAVDKLTSSQTAAMIVTARGRRGIEPFGKSGETFGWCVVKMQADPTSAADIYADQSELGYVTDSYRTDCSAFLIGGGGIRIEGLEVKGNIPPEGKAYIAALFARGVHLDILT